MFLNVDHLVKELEYQENLIQKFEQELLSLPEGSLTIKKINGTNYLYYQIYKSIDKNIETKAEMGIQRGIEAKIETQANEPGSFTGENRLENKLRSEQKCLLKCLSKDDTDLAIKITRKKYIKACLPVLIKNSNVLKSLLEKYETYDADQILSLMPKAYQLATEKYLLKIESKSEKIEKINNNENTEWLTKNNNENTEWLNLEEQKNNFYFESLRHVTSMGLAVRSKSEAIIAELLDANGLKYKYETKLKIRDKSFSPDFAILRADDNKIIYWEHFGMINNEEYLIKMFYKLNEYQKAEIILWDNLVITCDSEDGNIDARQIIRIIKKMLL